MALVTKTISTYMLVKHSKNAKEQYKEENLSPWGEPFFKKKGVKVKVPVTVSKVKITVSTKEIIQIMTLEVKPMTSQ